MPTPPVRSSCRALASTACRLTRGLSACAVALLLVAPAASAAAANQPAENAEDAESPESPATPAAAAAAHPLAPFAGPTWTVRGAELATGERLDADIVFTPLFGGTAMHERTVVRISDGDERLGFVYETLYGRSIDDGTFGFVTVGSDGTVMEGRGRMDDGVFTGATDRRTDGAPRGHRGLTRDGDRLTWSIERGDGDERRQLLDATMNMGGAGALALPAVADDGPARRLDPFIGTWTTDARWSTGERLRGRNVFRMGRGAGYAVNDTFARDGDGEAYHRYAALYVLDPDRGWTAYSADFGGGLSAAALTLRDAPEGLAIDVRTEGEPGSMSIDQTSASTGPDTFRWTVRVRQVPIQPDAAGFEWSEVMDATWTRVRANAGDRGNAAGADIAPIDPDRFDVRGEPGRSFTVRQTVPATPAACFRLWSTAEGIAAFTGFEATVELAIGGTYEWRILRDAPAGSRGSEGCQVLSWVPDRLLSFTWNAPPTQPEARARRSWVVVRFDEAEPGPDGAPRTLVQLDHAGFGEEPYWRDTEAYFQNAWPAVLGRMRAHLEASADGASGGGT